MSCATRQIDRAITKKPRGMRWYWRGMIDRRRTAQVLHDYAAKILPEYQNRGVGSAVIRDVLAQAQAEGLSVGLQVLKVNPARRLYERLGFSLVGETATHYLMRAMIPAPL